MTCAVSWCKRLARSRGWCPLHYKRWYRHGDPDRGSSYNHEPLALRLNRGMRPDENGCWIWVKSRNAAGYGKVWDGSRVRLAHRLAYETHVGPVPAGLELDHLCRVKSCINPAHLEPVSRGENVRRGWPDRRRRAESSLRS